MLSGIAIGVVSVLLVMAGNPKNMGFCIACFIRDIAGSLHLHQAGAVQYIRPEIIGMVLGAFLISLVKGEFSPRGGSSPLLRFAIGFCMMVGALVFLGCPLRMVLRLAGGDLNAVVGLLGFMGGVGLGCLFLSKGFSLGRSYRQSAVEGVLFPSLQMALFVLMTAAGGLFAWSVKGPGSMHAPVVLSLAAGLAVGILAQRTRLCMAGGLRDVFLFHDTTLLTGSLCIFLAALVGNLLTGSFHLSFAGQPVAHTSALWNFLGMSVVGLSAVMLGGCPLRQLILAGEGNTDSAMAVLGMLLGAASAHNFSLASSADGPTAGGKVMTLASLAFLAIVALFVIRKERSK